MYVGTTVFSFESRFLLQHGLKIVQYLWSSQLDINGKYKYTSVVPLVPAHIGTNALLKQKNLHQASYKRFILPLRNRGRGDSSMIAL